MSFYFKNIPSLRNQASVEEKRCDIGEKQDGHQGRQHADGPDWGALDIYTIYQSTSWEFDKWWYPKQRLPTQHPQQNACKAA